MTKNYQFSKGRIEQKSKLSKIFWISVINQLQYYLFELHPFGPIDFNCGQIDESEFCQDQSDLLPS